LSKTSIYVQNFDFCSKFQLLTKISIIKKISIFDKKFVFGENFDFRPKFNFCPKFQFLNAAPSNSAKVQEHLASVRISEKNSEEYRRNYEREKEKINKSRNDVDELRSERLNLIRERDEKEMKLSLSDEKLTNSETKARALELDLRKALQNEEQTRFEL